MVDPATKLSFDYGQAVLVQPSRTPNTAKHCRYDNTFIFGSSDTNLVGPFNFLPKAAGVLATQLIHIDQWRQLANACISSGLVPPKLSTDPVAATYTCLTHTAVNLIPWHHCITFANVVQLSSSNHQHQHM